jgi:hypothetical protein
MALRHRLDATLIPYRVRLLLQNEVTKRCLLHGKHRDKNRTGKGLKTKKPDWVLFEELVDYFEDRYHLTGMHKFPYRAMFESERGGGPESALVDSAQSFEKYERENETASKQEEQLREAQRSS